MMFTVSEWFLSLFLLYSLQRDQLASYFQVSRGNYWVRFARYWTIFCPDLTPWPMAETPHLCSLMSSCGFHSSTGRDGHSQAVNGLEDRLEQIPWDRHPHQLEDHSSGMSHHLGADLDELFPQGRQRPMTHRTRQDSLPKIVPQIVGQHKEHQPHLIVHKVMAGKPRPSHGIPPLLDPLLGCPPLIVKTHHPFCRPTQIGDDKSDAREELPPGAIPLWQSPGGNNSSSWPDTQNPYTEHGVFRRDVPPEEPETTQCLPSMCRWLEVGSHRKSFPFPDIHRGCPKSRFS
jgi:hypothetical protein